MTSKFSEALRALAEAPQGRITRAYKGFGRPRTSPSPLITRRTANALVCAGLADYNDRLLPSSITLTDKGRREAEAFNIAQVALAKTLGIHVQVAA